MHKARLAQSVERKALNLVVVGSSPTVGVFRIFIVFIAVYYVRSLVLVQIFSFLSLIYLSV